MRHQVHVSSGAVYGSYLVFNLNETLWRPRLSPCARGPLRSRPRRALTVAPHLAMLAAIGILV